MNNKQGNHGILFSFWMIKQNSYFSIKEENYGFLSDCFHFQKLGYFQFYGSSEWVIVGKVSHLISTTGPYQILGNAMGFSVIDLN